MLTPEVLFKVRQAEVTIFARATYKVQVPIGVIRSALYCTTCFVDKGAGPPPIQDVYLILVWKSCSKCLDPHQLWATTKESIKVEGIISLTVKMGTVQVGTGFGVGERSVVDILLGPTDT